MTDSLWSVLQQCWKESPQERPTASALLRMVEEADWSVIHPDPDLIAVACDWERPMYPKKGKAANDQARAEADTESANVEEPELTTGTRQEKEGVQEGELWSKSGGCFFPKVHVSLIRLCLFVAIDRKSTRLNSSHSGESRMPSSA